MDSPGTCTVMTEILRAFAPFRPRKRFGECQILHYRDRKSGQASHRFTEVCG